MSVEFNIVIDICYCFLSLKLFSIEIQKLRILANKLDEYT
ncbi:hypothetical protein CLU83_0752 [Flavobacterium sp. 1]|nr:hypothetical protein CLU83_0752 [Flavobacterium sp. 1]